MPRKTVTQKAQISKWYVKRIKDFANLTENEALFEYEALKLRERQRKYASKAGIKGYKAPQIPRPTVTISRDVEYLRNIPSEDVKLSATTGFDELVGPSASIYDYELEQWKEEKFPDYQSRYDYSWEDDLSEQSYDDYEPIYSEPTVENGASPEDYWIDPTTGEAILKSDTSDILSRTSEFLDRLIDYTESVANGEIISRSSYRSGRTKSAKSRQWLEDNIDRARDRIVNKLNDIKSSETKLRGFAEKASNGDFFGQLTNAIGEFIAGAYKSTNADSFQSSEVYNLLSDYPMTLDETLDFEDLSIADDYMQ